MKTMQFTKHIAYSVFCIIACAISFYAGYAGRKNKASDASCSVPAPALTAAAPTAVAPASSPRATTIVSTRTTSATTQSQTPLYAPILDRIVEICDNRNRGNDTFDEDIAELASIVKGRSSEELMGMIKHLDKNALNPYRVGWRGTHNFILGKLAEQNPEMAIAYADTLKTDIKSWARSTVISKWADKNPESALAYVATLKLNEKASYHSTIVTRWARKNPEAALEFVETLKESEKKSLYHTVATSWSKENPDDALAWHRTLPKNKTSERVFNSIVMQIAETDPDRAITLMDENPETSASISYWELGQLFGRIADDDPQKAAQSANNIKNAEQRSQVYREIATKWAQKNPLDALDWADTLPNANERKSVSDSIMREWTDNDSEGAIKYAKGFPEGVARNNAINEIADRLVRSDPAAAMALMDELPEGAERSRKINDLIYRWAGADLDRAIAHANAMPNEHQRMKTLEKIAEQVSYEDPEAALEIANQLSPNQRVSIISSNIGKLVGTDPERAFELLRSLPDGFEKRNALGSCGWHMNYDDPETVMTHIDMLPPGHQRDDIMFSAINKLARQNLDKAFAWIDSMPESESKKNAFNRVFQEWGKTDPVAALKYAVAEDVNLVGDTAQRYAEQDVKAAQRWYMSLPEGEAKNKALGGIVDSMRGDNPIDAANFIAQLPQSKARDDAAVSVVRSWAYNDPVAAANWAVSFTGDKQRKAVDSVASSWANKEPAAAGAWIVSLKDKEVRDNALVTYVNNTQNYYPQYAAKYATSIEDPEKREEAIYDTARNWIRNSPDEALAWLATTDLPDDRKKQITDRANRK